MSDTRSALYTGWVRHRRYRPERRDFRYRIAMPLLDLDAVPELEAAGILGRRRWSPLRFRPDDYGPASDRATRDGSASGLARTIRDLVARREGFRPDGPVLLLAHVRTWGWCFNPLAVYWCHDRGGAVSAAVLEVTNTPWHERVAYTLDLRGHRPPWRRTHRKRLHVSPFLPMGLDHRIRLSAPAERVTVGVDDLDVDTGECVFDADMVVERRPLTAATVRRMLLTHPMMTLRVSAAIHTQAARLLLRRTPVHRHQDPVPAAEIAPAASGHAARTEPWT